MLYHSPISQLRLNQNHRKETLGNQPQAGLGTWVWPRRAIQSEEANDRPQGCRQNPAEARGFGCIPFLRSFNEASVTLCSVAGRRSASPVPISSQGPFPLGSGSPLPTLPGRTQVCRCVCSAGEAGCGVRTLVLPGESRCLGPKAGLEGSTRPSNALTGEKVSVSVCVE